MATPKKTRSRKRPGEPTVPAGTEVWAPEWTPGKAPPWLDAVLAGPLPHDRHTANRGHPKGSQSVRDAIVGHMAGCGSWVHSCKMAGISDRSGSDWLERGRADQEAWEQRLAAGQDPGTPTELHLFARAVMLAGAWWSGRRLAKLQNLADDPATPRQLQAAIHQWLLSRVGDKLTERLEVQHSGEVTTTVTDVAEQMRAKIEEMRRRRETLEGGEAT